MAWVGAGRGARRGRPHRAAHEHSRGDRRAACRSTSRSGRKDLGGPRRRSLSASPRSPSCSDEQASLCLERGRHPPRGQGRQGSSLACRRPMARPASPGPQGGARSIGRTSAPRPDQSEATPLRGGGGDSGHGQGGRADSESGRGSPDTPRRAPRCSHRGIVAPRAGKRRRLPRQCLRSWAHGGRAATSPAQASAWLASHVGAAREAEAPSLDELSHVPRPQRPRTVCKSRTCS